ncbi:MAG: tyrosine--tRNA ligase [Saprospiraceae bacterium]|nr:tyrosine--tRNA ligase [Saprospiraceae bacterium]
MNFLDELKWRGMLQDMTPGLEEVLGKRTVAYIGFDPTAPSLTIGNYVQVMILKLFQQAGHQPIVLMGGATGRIGDPSGKDKERELKSTEELDRNLSFQISQFRKLLDFEGVNNPALLVNNLDFYREMNVLDFLRNVGKTLTINYMLAKDSVKNRIETGMSFTEFSYQLLQAYDFLCLYEKYDCVLQMGGSDQWGNITSGTEFIRRNADGKAYALTTPLLTKADGKKFGKSEQGNIWLDPKMTSPYKFFQFWINADDRDMPKFYRYFSLRSQDEIETLEKTLNENPNELKRVLAEELTRRIHGEANYEAALKVSEILFNQRLDHDYLRQLTEEQWELITEEIPSKIMDLPEVNVNVIDFLTEQTGLLASKSEVRRAIQGNALAINKIKVNSLEMMIRQEDWLHGHYMLVENGKKTKFALKG